jgi:hypothetical protein
MLKSKILFSRLNLTTNETNRAKTSIEIFQIGDFSLYILPSKLKLNKFWNNPHLLKEQSEFEKQA